MAISINKSLRAVHLGSPRLKRLGEPYIAGVCLHDTSGTGKHNDTQYLADPGDGRKVSVDFTVERDGSIFQLNPDLPGHYTLHAGRSTKFVDRFGAVYKNNAVTRVLIGIELVQKANMSLIPQWPPDQVQAAAELCLTLCQRFNFGKDQITTHSRIITDGSRIDPRGFPMSSFWFFFNRAANIPAIDPPKDSIGAPSIYRVGAGDTLTSIAKRFNTSIESIKSLNGLNDPSNLILAGQVLTIRR
jgi:hypothetical protein